MAWKTCPDCQGLGKVPEYVTYKTKDGTKDTFREWTKCRTCKGTGVK